MKLVFEENKERKWNELNEKSVKLRHRDLDLIEEFDYVSFFDDSGNKILDCSLYLPEDKAYIIFNRVSFRKSIYNGRQKDAMKMFINHLLNPNNIKYILSVIYFEHVGGGVDREILKELGFFDLSIDSSLSFLINENFEQTISNISISDKVRCSVLQDYGILKNKYNCLLTDIRKRLEEEKFYLENMKKEGDKREDIIEMKKIGILHYERILGIDQKNETSR